MVETTDPYPKYLDWLQYLSACLLFAYGLSKLLGIQFNLPPEMAQRPVGSLTGHQLTWYYYSYSHAYANIIGLTQLAGGVMLLFRKTAMLGAAIILPVISNIFMVNIFFSITWGALCTSAFIFASMLAILWHHRRPLIDAFWTDRASEPAGVQRYYRAVAAAVVLLIIALMGVASWFNRGV